MKTRISVYPIVTTEMVSHNAGFSNYGAEMNLSEQVEFPTGFIGAICMGVFYRTSSSRLGIGNVHGTKVTVNTNVPGEYSIRILYFYKTPT